MFDESYLRKCNSCGKDFAKTAKECPYCGKNLNTGLVFKLIIGIGLLAIVTNSIQLVARSFLNLGNETEICASFPFCKELTVFVINILVGFLFTVWGSALLLKKRWAESLSQNFGYWSFALIFLVIFIIDPILVKLGFGPIK